jgi:hypothetical protein
MWESWKIPGYHNFLIIFHLQSHKMIKSKFQPKSQILIFILTYADSLSTIIYEISGKKLSILCYGKEASYGRLL